MKKFKVWVAEENIYTVIVEAENYVQAEVLADAIITAGEPVDKKHKLGLADININAIRSEKL